MSLSIDELSALYGLNGVNGLTQPNGQNTTSAGDATAKDGDSYISTIGTMDASAAIPSENYNDLARAIKLASGASEAAKIGKTESATTAGIIASDETSTGAVGSTGASGSTSTESTGAVGDAESEGTGSVGGAGGAGGGGGSSDSDEETETEIVTINGQTYLQTTTTDSSGNTTVSRVPLGDSSQSGSEGIATPSVAAQALAGM